MWSTAVVLIGRRVLRSRACSSFHSILPSFGLSRHFLGIVSLVFSKFWHGARNPYEFVYDRAGFSTIFFFFPPKIWKRTKTGLETVFFELIEKIGLQFLLNLLCNENICYLQFSYANGMFGKIFVPEIWA